MKATILFLMFMLFQIGTILFFRNMKGNVVGISILGAYHSIVQQENQNPEWISNEPGTFTQFNLTKKYDNLGLLIHSELSYDTIYDMRPGDLVHVYYSRGGIDTYKIDEIHEYRALSPNDPHSQFIDMKTGKELSSTKLFYLMYALHGITLQTCTNYRGIINYGRYFVVGHKVRGVIHGS